jgi:hypothetical protein
VNTAFDVSSPIRVISLMDGSFLGSQQPKLGTLMPWGRPPQHLLAGLILRCWARDRARVSQMTAALRQPMTPEEFLTRGEGQALPGVCHGFAPAPHGSEDR